MTLAIVGGYRLVRKVGDGDRAEVWLGHPVEEGPPPAVLKIFAPTTSSASVSGEIEALARAAGPHVVGVLDVTTTTDGRVALVLERLGTHTLATLLTVRRGLRAGEAVTILAPVLQAVARMHAAGVTHGALRAGAIGFTDHGAPVLACFGSAEAAPGPTAPVHRARDARIAEDAHGLASLCRDVLSAIPGSEAVLAWLEEHEHDADWPRDFGPRLFAWAVPEAVDFERAEPVPRIVPPVAMRPRRSATRGGVVDRAAALLDTDWVAWARRHAAAVRPRFWIAGGAVAAALVVAVALVPAPSSDASSVRPAPTPTPVASLSDDSTEDAAVRGDDPVAALEVLLDTRERCIRELSVLCLDAVAQPGSGALARDQQLVRDLQSGAEAPPPEGRREVTLEELIGGTALLSVTADNAEPASILVMRSEAGWRIRDYLDEG